MLNIKSQFINIKSIILYVVFFCIYNKVIIKLISEWSDDPNYSHGFIIPLVSGYLIWEERNRLSKVFLEPSIWGLWVLISGLFLFIIGYVGAEAFTMRFSMLVVFGGVIIVNYGTGFFKAILLPYGYLYFMIPLPYLIYNLIAFPLKLLVAKYSVIALQLISIPVHREGNIIMLPHITLEVADACSGLRSLISLFALGVAFAYFSQKTFSKRFFLVLITIPIAVFANGIRVFGTGILSHLFGVNAARGFFHEFAGMVIFGVSISLLIIIGLILKGVKPGGKVTS